MNLIESFRLKCTERLVHIPFGFNVLASLNALNWGTFNSIVFIVTFTQIHRYMRTLIQPLCENNSTPVDLNTPLWFNGLSYFLAFEGWYDGDSIGFSRIKRAWLSCTQTTATTSAMRFVHAVVVGRKVTRLSPAFPNHLFFHVSYNYYY